MKALFIGGTGTISTDVVALAQQRGWEITLLNRGSKKMPEGIHSIIADINDEEAVAKAIALEHYDVVAQFIGYTAEDVKRDIRLFQNKTRQYIFISSASAYQKPLTDYRITESSYIQAQSALESAYTELAKLTIKAPFKGAIVNLPYFTPNVEIASGETMVGLMDYSQMYMEIALPENTIDKVKVGQKVLVTNYNIKSDTLSGLVSQLSPAINEDTRTYTGYITINNPALKLRPGMFAKGEIITLQKDSVIAIPKDIVNSRRGGNRIVYTIEQNRAMEKIITTGISDDRFIEVENGLNQGDKIVVKGYEFLRNRGKVKIMK